LSEVRTTGAAVLVAEGLERTAPVAELARTALATEPVRTALETEPVRTALETVQLP